MNLRVNPRLSASTTTRFLVAASMILSLVAVPLAAPITAHATGGISGKILDNVNKSVGKGTAGSGGTGSEALFPSGSIQEIIYRIIRTFFLLLGLIFLGMMLYGGYNWMTAMGEEEKVETAKKTITSSIIGIAIIIASYAIVTFIINSVYNSATPAAGGATSGTGGFNADGTPRPVDDTGIGFSSGWNRFTAVVIPALSGNPEKNIKIKLFLFTFVSGSRIKSGMTNFFKKNNVPNRLTAT